MDIGKSFTYMFDDENWVQKLAIGGLLALVSIIPIVNIFTMLVLVGYALRVLQNVANKKEVPLPEWDDWGGDWLRGLMVALGWLIYSIPLIVISGLSWIVTAATGYSSSDVEGVFAICVAALSCLSALWGLAEAVVFPSALLRYAEEEQFGAFFKFGDIFKFIGDNLSNYIVAILLAFVARIVAGFGVIICVIGLFFTYFWGTLVGVHLLGQVKAEAVPAVVAAAAGAESYGDLDASAISEDESEE